jgi:hypothetical protein
MARDVSVQVELLGPVLHVPVTLMIVLVVGGWTAGWVSTAIFWWTVIGFAVAM